MGIVLSPSSFAFADSADSGGVEMHAGDFVSSAWAEFPPMGGRPNLLRLSLKNPHERAVDLLVAIYFDVDSTLQYGRRVQMPPNSRMRVWLPVQVPDTKHIVDGAFPYHMMVQMIGDATGLLPEKTGALQLERTLQVASRAGASTGLIHTPQTFRTLDTELVIERTADPLRFVQAARDVSTTGRNWISIQPGFSANGETGLKALDQLVIANDRLLDDPTEAPAVRRWLYGGGKVWVMLDRVRSQTLELILGDRYRGEELERVQLTSVQLVPADGEESPRRDFDVPVPMTRILLDDADVLYTIDGWPAAFRMECGQGELYVTTAGSDAWLRPSLDSGVEVEFTPLEPISEVAATLFPKKEPPIAARTALASHAESSIGYDIPNRNVVLAILLGYGCCLVLLAVVLFRIRRLPVFGLLASLLAAGAAGGLLSLKLSGQNAPSTVMMTQIVKPIPGTDDVLIEGAAGLYSAESAPLVLAGDSGGWLTPEWDGFRGGIRVLTRTGSASWEWQNLHSTPGFRTAEFQESSSPGRVEVVATLNAEGVSGTWKLPNEFVPEDAIIQATSGRIGVQFSEDGSFTATQNSILGKEQFLGANLLGTEQRRRVAVLKELLTDENQPWDFAQPNLLFWTKPWNQGLRFGDDVRQEGTALVAVPIRFQRPPTGSVITIPAPLVYYRGVTGPDGLAPSGMYDYRKREWIEKRGLSEIWLGFACPDELRPLTLNRVDAQIRVSGPVGRFELWGWDGRERVKLQAWENPVGTLKASLEQESVLKLSSDGQFLLFVSAGVKSGTSAILDAPKSPWKVEAFHLSMNAAIP